MRELRARLRELLGMAPTRSGVPQAPTVRIGLAGAVPGALVRVLPGLLLLLATALAGAGGVWWVVSVAAALALTARPEWPVVPAFLLLVGVWVYAGPDLAGVVQAREGGLVRLGALVACVHLLVRAAGLATHVGWRTWVELAVLGRALRSVVAVQVVVQALVLASVWVRVNLGAGLGGSAGLRLLAVAAVVAVVLLVLPREWLDPRARGR